MTIRLRRNVTVETPAVLAARIPTVRTNVRIIRTIRMIIVIVVTLATVILMLQISNHNKENDNKSNQLVATPILVHPAEHWISTALQKSTRALVQTYNLKNKKHKVHLEIPYKAFYCPSLNPKP